MVPYKKLRDPYKISRNTREVLWGVYSWSNHNRIIMRQLSLMFVNFHEILLKASRLSQCCKYNCSLTQPLQSMQSYISIKFHSMHTFRMVYFINFFQLKRGFTCTLQTLYNLYIHMCFICFVHFTYLVHLLYFMHFMWSLNSFRICILHFNPYILLFIFHMFHKAYIIMYNVRSSM